MLSILVLDLVASFFVLINTSNSRHVASVGTFHISLVSKLMKLSSDLKEQCVGFSGV